MCVGVQVKTGPKSLLERVIKVADRNLTVDNLLVELLEGAKLIDAIECYDSDPDKVTTAPAITLTSNVPVSVV